MYLISIPKFVRKLIYHSAIWQIPTQNKVLFLTFDDGPLPQTTPIILEILKKYNAKATFFCVGENLKKHSLEKEKIIDDGHVIGNHTYNHLNGWKYTTIDYLKNFQLFEENFSTRLFRPPYGKMKPSQIKNINTNHRIVLWTVLSGDWDNKISSDDCLKNVLKYSKKGSIIVFHDSLKAIDKVKKVLPIFIEHFQSRGYQFAGLTNQYI